jgi:starch phosphorylase
MKFALNGAITIGTLDGANIEIRDAVGAENFFLFGLTAPQVSDLKASGYHPWDYYNANPELREILDQIASGYFSGGNRDLFKPLVEALMSRDEYLLCADYQAYIECQEQASEAYRNKENWTRMSILNTARTGYFSSDRAIRQYAEEIWYAQPVQVDLEANL